MNKQQIHDICILCKKLVGNGEKNKDNVRVKTFLLSSYLDMVVHTRCWNKLKINIYDRGERSE
jgi:hypothetical protein